MALNFPNSPSLNDLHEENQTKWRWNGSSWIRVVTTSTAGAQGFQGAAGAQGATAATGAQGAAGSQGSPGTFGGASFEYDFSTTTTDSDPGAGTLRFNNANLTSATILYIDDSEGGSTPTDIQSYLRTIDDSTSTIKGHYKVSLKSNPESFVLYTISSLTEATGYFKVTSSYVSGSVTSFSNGAELFVTFARTGDKETLVLKVLQVLKVLLEVLVEQDQLVHKVLKVITVPLVLKVHKVIKVFKVHRLT